MRMGMGMSMTMQKLDILVCGGGYVGLSAALAIKANAPSLDIAVIDAAPAEVWRKDQRASTIAAGAKRLLTTLGVWDAVAPEAQAVSEMIVTDSRTSDPVRPVFLTFGGEIEGAREDHSRLVGSTDPTQVIQGQPREFVSAPCCPAVGVLHERKDTPHSDARPGECTFFSHLRWISARSRSRPR